MEPADVAKLATREEWARREGVALDRGGWHLGQKLSDGGTVFPDIPQTHWATGLPLIDYEDGEVFDDAGGSLPTKRGVYQSPGDAAEVVG